MVRYYGFLYVLSITLFIVDQFTVNFGNTLLGNAACVFMASTAIQVSNVPGETQPSHSTVIET